MATYYIKDNEQIVLFDTDKQRLVNTLDFMPQYKDLPILETENVIVDGVIMTQEEYDEMEQQKEQERINSLTMTSLDLITFINKQGVGFDVIQTYLQANPMLNMQLTYCQNCYCGVVRQLCPLPIGEVEFTDEMVVNAFKIKNGEPAEEPKIEGIEVEEATEENSETDENEEVEEIDIEEN